MLAKRIGAGCGFYTVTVSAEDQEGRSGSASTEIKVQ
jgi:hypothetical protein